MRGQETDHVISVPMRGLEINFTGRGQTYMHHTNGHSENIQNIANGKYIHECTNVIPFYYI